MYYALLPQAGRVCDSLPERVKLLRVSLAGYLDRAAIVRGIRGNRVEIATGAQWAEPLSEMLTRVLGEALSQRLPRAGVFPEGTLNVQPDLLLLVSIERFEMSGDTVVLQAHVVHARVGQPASLPQRVYLEAKPKGGSTSALVECQNVLLGRLADQILNVLCA